LFLSTGRSSAVWGYIICKADPRPAHSKPYTGIEDQLKLLASRGLDETHENRAKRWLERVGYYRLSAYAYPFRKLEDRDGRTVRLDQFRDGLAFNDVTDFYLFDKQIRLLLSDPLERIEIAVRNALVDTLGALNPFGHRDTRSYKNSFKIELNDDGEMLFEAFIQGLDKAFARSKAESAKHFRRKYSGPPPIWIAAEEWTWGNMSYMLQNLNQKNRDAVAVRFGLQRGTLVSWMSSLNELRNRCAHHLRTWNRPFVNIPQIKPGKLPYLTALAPVGGPVPQQIRTRLYGCVAVIIYLLRQLHEDTQWPTRFRAFLLEANLPEEISLDSAGFIDGWEDHSLWTA
jgi:abortive infection bacteriophage resistance protein